MFNFFSYIYNIYNSRFFYLKFAACLFSIFAVLFLLHWIDVTYISECAKRSSAPASEIIAFTSDAELKQFLNLEAVKAKEEYIRANWVKLREHPYIVELISTDKGVPIHFALKNFGAALFYLSVVIFSCRVQPNLDLNVFYNPLLSCSIISDLFLCAFSMCFFDIDSKVYQSNVVVPMEDLEHTCSRGNVESTAEVKPEDLGVKYLADLANNYNFLSLSMMFIYLLNKPDYIFSNEEVIQIGLTLAFASFNYYVCNIAAIPQSSSSINIDSICDNSNSCNDTGTTDSDTKSIEDVNSIIIKQDRFIEAVVSLLLLVCE